MSITLRNLSLEMIEGCAEIHSWLSQFPNDQRTTAIAMLLKLQFVTRDNYAEWLKTTLTGLSVNPRALYAVRKFDKESELWDDAGEVVRRPSSSLGSEDLVQSVVASLIKSNEGYFLDNPNLNDLKGRKVHDIALLDDSIGSGNRVSTFIQMMMKNKTFLSWWSLGWIHLDIVAFARTSESASRIIKTLPGSDHPVRKFPKSHKVHFISHLTYQETNLASRWGTNYQSTLDLCRSQKGVPTHFRLGFGEIMANVVFYHSIPDNIPGILWYDENKKWTPLFPNRSVPEWLPRLLDTTPQGQTQIAMGNVPKSLSAVLKLIKKGVRNRNSLAHSLGIDVKVLLQILSQGQQSGFLTPGTRLTEAGLRAVRAEHAVSGVKLFDRSLYIPHKWCVGRETVQPSGPAVENHRAQTDSTDSSSFVGGEAGQASLERTDAKTASPSLSVMPLVPSQPRKGHDTHGPQGSKER